jgi:hypothetical protein
MAVTFANHFTLRVTSANIDEPTSKWMNTIDILSTAGAPDPDSDIVGAFIAAIADNQWHDSQVISAALTNWTRGDVPLDEQGNLWERENIDQVGDAKAVYDLTESGPADTDICMLMHKAQASPGGRIGKLFLHNLFRADMVDNQVGRKPTIVSGLAGFPALVTANFTLNMGDFFGASANPGFVTVHWSAKPGAAAPFARGITEIDAIRLTEHQFGRTNG